MKRYFRFSAICFLALLSLYIITVSIPELSNDSIKHTEITPEIGCSSICLVNNGYAVYGGNMDWSELDAGLFYINKKGLQKTGIIASTNGKYANWIAKYASATINLVGYNYPWGGINEKGLMFATMSLRPIARSSDPDERPPLDSGMWVQYMLDMCETIDDVLATQPDIRMITSDHYLVSDRFGNCAVIEWLQGKRVVHREKNLPVAVCTNSPYSKALHEWQNKKEGGLLWKWLQWFSVDTSIQRFVSAADQVDSFNSTNIDNTVKYAFDVLYSIRGEKYTKHASQWSVVFDAKNMRIYFRTARHPTIRYFDFYDFDFSCDTPVQMLDVHKRHSGYVSGAFSDFDFDLSLAHYQRFCQYWGVSTPASYLENNMRIFSQAPCTEESKKISPPVTSGAVFSQIETKPETVLQSGQIWSGTYDCGQGKTDLKLKILEVDSSSQVKAIFDFNFNNGSATGEFYLNGKYFPSAQNAIFEAGEWIRNPNNYTAVGMYGSFTNNETKFSGNLTYSACKGFEVYLQ